MHGRSGLTLSRAVQDRLDHLARRLPLVEMRRLSRTFTIDRGPGPRRRARRGQDPGGAGGAAGDHFRCVAGPRIESLAPVRS